MSVRGYYPFEDIDWDWWFDRLVTIGDGENGGGGCALHGYSL